MNTETSLQDDIAYLRRIAEEGRRLASASGDHMVLWGLLIPGALVCQYLKSTHAIAIPEYFWAFVVAIGWFVSMILGRRIANRPGGRSPGNRIYGAIWIASGISMTVTLAGALMSGFPLPGVLTIIISAVLGVAFAAWAQISGLRWFYLIAAGWWLAAFGLFFLPQNATYLLISAGIYLALIAIPGFALMLQPKTAP